MKYLLELDKNYKYGKRFHETLRLKHYESELILKKVEAKKIARKALRFQRDSKYRKELIKSRSKSKKKKEKE